MLNPWKRDVMPDKPPAHHGRGGTVGGGGNCAADTEVSKQSYVGRDETMVGSSKVVVGHITIELSLFFEIIAYLVLFIRQVAATF